MDSETAVRTTRQSLQLLREGRFAEAWPLFEGRRWAKGSHTNAPIADYPEWMGEDLTGKHVMVGQELGR